MNKRYQLIQKVLNVPISNDREQNIVDYKLIHVGYSANVVHVWSISYILFAVIPLQIWNPSTPLKFKK